MAKQIQLTIPKPCHENWDGMTNVEKGKFCGSCQKQVVDFTIMSDRQLAEFFKKPSTGSVCGRFMTDQLERDIVIPKKRIPWLKYFFTIALPAFFVSKISAQQKPKLIGKIAYRPTKGTIALTTVEPVRMLGEVSSTILPFPKADTTKAENPLKCGPIVNSVITGKVINEMGEPIPNASVSFTKRGNSIMADAKGEFVFPEFWVKEGEILTFSSAGYLNKSVEAIQFKKAGNEVKLAIPVLDEIVVQSYPVKGQVIVVAGMVMIKVPDTINVANVVEEEIKPETTEKDVKGIKLYPNPVKAGTPINLKINKLKEGYYSFQIISTAGQMAHQKEIWIDANAKLLSIDVPTVAAGTYVLQIVYKKSGVKFSEKLIVL